MLAAPLWALPFLIVVHTAGGVAARDNGHARAVVVLHVQTPRGRTANRVGHLLGFALVGGFTLTVVLPLVGPTLRVLTPTTASVLLSALGLTIIGVALIPTIPTPADARATWARRDQPHHPAPDG